MILSIKKYPLFVLILASFVLIAGIFETQTYLGLIAQKNRLVEEEIQANLKTLQFLDKTIFSPVWHFRRIVEPLLTQEFLDQVAGLEGVLSVEVTDYLGEVYLASGESLQKTGIERAKIISAISKKVYSEEFRINNKTSRLLVYEGDFDKIFWLAFSEEEINKTIQNLIWQNSVIGIFWLLVFAAMFLIILRIVLKPIQELKNLFGRVREGDLNVKAKIKSKTELGDLAVSFNEMVNSLKGVREKEKLLARIKSEFISIAAHRLRTPLSVVKWALRIVAEEDIGNLKAEQKDTLEKAYQANEIMIQLVSDLLDVARIEEGRFGYNFSYADLREIVEKQVKNLELVTQGKNISVFLRESQTFPKIKMDSEKISMVLENLLDNAVNYTLTGGSIDIIMEKKEDFIEITVKDTGVGIPKHQMNRLFTKFFRGENVVRMQTEGSGLGLFIAKNIIKRHGGEIWVESEEGKGTVVHFTLPINEKLIPSQAEVAEEVVVG